MSEANKRTELLNLASRFRHWYEYEKDCNAKTLRMLLSVPAAARSAPAFEKAVGKLAHLVAARHMWLYRVGATPDRPESWTPPTTLEEMPALVRDIESRWTNYLAGLNDDDLAGYFECTGSDGKRYRWELVNLLTQVFGHAWYHRGQIAMLVKECGGEAVDTDFIYWDKPSVIEPAARKDGQK